jgi:hypothetical protein
MTGNPPPVQVFPGVVILTGQALKDSYFLCSAGIREASRLGYSTTRFEGIRRAIHDADVALERHRDVACDAIEARSASEEEITTAVAEVLTGLSRRQVQRLAKSGLGRRVGRIWLLRRDLLLAELAHRKGKHRP